MATDKNTVTLSNPELGEQKFEKSHAERILAFDKRKGVTTWALHDSKLKFEHGKIISSGSTGSNQDAG